MQLWTSIVRLNKELDLIENWRKGNKQCCNLNEWTIKWALLLVLRAVRKLVSPNRPFYNCVLGTLAFEWMWGWSWPCFSYVNHVQKNSWHKNNMVYIWKAERFVSKQGQLHSYQFLAITAAVVGFTLLWYTLRLFSVYSYDLHYCNSPVILK